MPDTQPVTPELLQGVQEWITETLRATTAYRIERLRVWPLVGKPSGMLLVVRIVGDRVTCELSCPQAEYLQAAIAKHHAAQGHDRCRECDDALYAAAGLEPDHSFPPFREALRGCIQYCVNHAPDPPEFKDVRDVVELASGDYLFQRGMDSVERIERILNEVEANDAKAEQPAG